MIDCAKSYKSAVVELINNTPHVMKLVSGAYEDIPNGAKLPYINIECENAGVDIEDFIKSDVINCTVFIHAEKYEQAHQIICAVKAMLYHEEIIMPECQLIRASFVNESGDVTDDGLGYLARIDSVAYIGDEGLEG
jgi:hypothetical protein